MKPGTPPLKSARLLDQVQERVRYLHYSLKTEKAYLYWIRFFIRWIAAQGAGMRHPRDSNSSATVQRYPQENMAQYDSLPFRVARYTQ